MFQLCGAFINRLNLSWITTLHSRVWKYIYSGIYFYKIIKKNYANQFLIKKVILT
jgi:hypothetical protein